MNTYEIEMNFICTEEDPSTPYEQITYTINAESFEEAKTIAENKASQHKDYNPIKDIIEINTYSRIDDVDAILNIDIDTIKKVNKAIYEDYYDKDLSSLLFSKKLSNGYTFEINVCTEKEDGGSTWLNPILFDSDGYEIDYLDSADYTRLDDEFVFTDYEDNEQEYRLLIREH